MVRPGIPGPLAQREVEELDQWSTLRSKAGKRVSILPSNASTSKTITDPWLITTAEQLMFFIQRDPDAVMQMLQTLREAHDASKELVELAEEESNRYDGAMDAALQAQELQIKYQGEARKYKQDAMNKQIRVTALEEELSQVEEARRLDLLAGPGGAEGPTSGTLGGGLNSPLGGNSGMEGSPAPTDLTGRSESHHRSRNHPDPPLFTGDQVTGPKWKDWDLKIDDKLQANSDYWKDDTARARYVISRTSGDASDHINAYREDDPNHFKTPAEVRQILKDIYADKNERQNARREYVRLRMRHDEIFGQFFPTFRKLGTILKYSDAQLCEELPEKLPVRLKEQVNNQQKDWNSLAEMRKYLQGLDDGQHNLLAADARAKALSQKKAEQAGATRTNQRYGATKVTTATPAVTIMQRPAIAAPQAPTGYLKPAPPSINPIRCSNCNELGHVAHNCPKPKKEGAAVHEMEVEEKEEDSENSENE